MYAYTSSILAIHLIHSFSSICSLMNVVTGALENVFGLFSYSTRHPMIDAAHGYVDGSNFERNPLPGSVSDTVLRPECFPMSTSRISNLPHCTTDSASAKVGTSGWVPTDVPLGLGHKREFGQLHHGENQLQHPLPVVQNTHYPKRQRLDDQAQRMPAQVDPPRKVRIKPPPFRTKSQNQALAYWITILVIEAFDPELRKFGKLVCKLCYLISRVIDGKTINPETSVVFLAPHYLRRLVDSGLAGLSHNNSPALFEAMFQWFMLSLNFASIWLDEQRLHTMTMTSWMRVDLKTYRTMERQAYIALEHNLALLAADWDRWLDELNDHLGSNIFRNLNIAILYDLLERSRTKHAFWQIPAHRSLSDPVASSVFLDGAYCMCAAVGSYSQRGLPTHGASTHIVDSAHMRPLESIHVLDAPITSYSCPVHSSDYRVYATGTPAASYDALNGSVGTLSSVALSDSYMASCSNQEPNRPESSAREEDIVTQRPYSSLFSDNIQSITSAPVSLDSLSSSRVHDGRSHQNVQEGFGKAESYMDFEDTETESDCDTCYSESDIGEQSLQVPVPTGVGGGGLSPLLSRRPLPKGFPVEDNRMLLSVNPTSQSSSRLMDIPESRSNPLPPLRLPYSSSQSYLASTSEVQVSRQQAVGELEAPISGQVCTGGFQEQQLPQLGPRPMVSGVFHPFISRKLKIASQ
ncbi:hypothetical protein VKT23_012128 [Stygiomarasmius scandens]|uniref:Uncharacterized protein n=1 Tax=Marasmiellus scandens TaxID=2682957 RepID=A0ABR1J704_9AGAR